MKLQSWWQIGLVAAAFGLALPARADIHVVEMQSNFFTPLKTVIQHGDTVHFVLKAGVHTTTSDPNSPKSWDSGIISTLNQIFPVVFTPADGPGPFPYQCDLHLGMQDTIFVAAGGCCQGMRGDAASPADGIIDLTDMQFIIDFVFFSGSGPVCLDEADCASPADSVVDLSDMQAVIDFVFFGGSIANCP